MPDVRNGPKADIVHDKQKDRLAAVFTNIDVYWLAIQRRVSTVLGSGMAVSERPGYSWFSPWAE